MARHCVLILVLASVLLTGCARRRPPAPAPAPAPPAGSPAAAAPAPAPPPPPVRVEEALPVPPQPLAEDAIANRSLDDLNRDSPFKPVFFALDSAELDEAGRAVATASAQLLRKYPTWVITIEGHCDERGTAEYNLALGERRAVAVKTYLASLGISPDRIRTVSYGKEFPFDPGHDEAAWSKNRRAHFVITSK
ncbi:MAG: peptidoglycan-associated lipoprotein Pal [Acidobacteria bacterium]|nr:peptidoglycan-associated lipoprotein Pal [Acidobacteriota bacterium]